MNKTNLLLIVPTLAAGGQERTAVNTTAILTERFNITMVVFTMDMAVYNPICEVININIPAKDGYLNKIINVVKRTRKLKKLKRELKTDVSLSFGNTANLVNALSKVSDKTILSIRGYRGILGSLVSRIIDKLVYRIADTIICVAEKMTRDLVESYHLPEEKVHTLYNPYDFESIINQASQPIPLIVRHPAIVTMGRLEKVKGFHHLLKAFKIVSEELLGATLIIIGEGEERDELEKFAAEKGLSEQIIFAGFQSNPFSYLNKCDIYVLSSIHEGFPNALIEAMVCGLPVVATDCKSGPREIFTESYNDTIATAVEYADYGILVPPFTADESNEPVLDQLFADAILRLLKDREIYERYKKKSQDRARMYSFDYYSERIISIIEK